MTSLPDPLTIIVVLVSLSLAPFLAMMVTSFLKITIVLSLVRNALGIQSIPSNMVINGLAIILSMYIMAPVAQQSYTIMEENGVGESKDIRSVMAGISKAQEPLRQFLLKHAHDRQRAFFLRSAQVLWTPEQAASLQPDSFMVLVPAFTVSELTEAFQIGFLLYLPFVAIDIIVSNILLAMGMMMVSPMTISLPFKLLLFVLVDGWTRLIHGLVLQYK